MTSETSNQCRSGNVQTDPADQRDPPVPEASLATVRD
jgi:hypothetical protein